MGSLLSTSVKSGSLRGSKLLVYSECLKDEYPEILRFFQDENLSLSVCMERTHINKVGFKLFNIIKLSGIVELNILTIDGSPHCIQLHFLGEHFKRALGVSIPINHYVIEKGKIFSIPIEAIKLARHLSQCIKYI